MFATIPTPDETRPDPRDCSSQLSQAERDADYNNNEAVADSAGLRHADGLLVRAAQHLVAGHAS